jgi:hypothetical protein
MINFNRLEKLKSMLIRDKNLSTIWDFYMDHFADHLEFIQMGNRTSNPMLEKIISVVSQQLFKQEPDPLLLIRLPEYKFIHGPVAVRGRLGGVIYFEELSKGMLAISATPGSSLIKYSRFTGYPLDSDEAADLN